MSNAIISEYSLHTPLVSDLEQRLGARDLLTWLDGEADTLAQLGLQSSTWVNLTAEKLLAARNIVQFRQESRLGEHASIESGPRGYVIRYRKGIPSLRLRFSLAHEIGHTYWFKTTEAGEPISTYQWSASGAATIEHLCDFFARCLLLPRTQLQRRLEDFDNKPIPPLHKIPSLSQHFFVADQAVARRLLFQIFPQRVGIIKLKRPLPVNILESSRSDWALTWCAVPAEQRSAHGVSGLRVPFLTSSRLIPDAMVPNAKESSTELFEVDGRWLDGLTPQKAAISRTAFKSRAARRGVPAFAYLWRPTSNLSLLTTDAGFEYLYLAISLEDILPNCKSLEGGKS